MRFFSDSVTGVFHKDHNFSAEGESASGRKEFRGLPVWAISPPVFMWPKRRDGGGRNTDST